MSRCATRRKCETAFATLVLLIGSVCAAGQAGSARAGLDLVAPKVTVSDWKSLSPFDGVRTSHQSLVIGDKVYVIGGFAWNSAEQKIILYDDVQYSQIAANGSLAGWHKTAGFHGGRSGHSSVFYKGKLYVIAGGDGVHYFDDVQYAPVTADGTIADATWVTSPNHLNVPRSVQGAAVLESRSGKAYLYVIGGVGEVNGKTVHFNTVEFAPLNPDGSVGKWVLSPKTFINGRSSPGAFMSSGCLYVVAGWGDRDNDIYSDAQSNCLKEDGSLGEWHNTSHSLCRGRYGHATVLLPAPAGSYAIELGGNAGKGQYLDDFQVASIQRGKTSSWVLLSPDASFPEPRWGHTAVLYQGRVFILGGSAPKGVYLNDVQVASVSTK